MIPEKDIPELVEWLMDIRTTHYSPAGLQAFSLFYTWDLAKLGERLTAALKAFNEREQDDT
jgi:hypothetical protein